MNNFCCQSVGSILALTPITELVRSFTALLCRPFLLPCLITAGVGVVTVIASLVFIEESHPDVKDAPGGWPGHVLRLLLRLLTCTAISHEAKVAIAVSGGSLLVGLKNQPIQEASPTHSVAANRIQQVAKGGCFICRVRCNRPHVLSTAVAFLLSRMGWG